MIVGQRVELFELELATSIAEHGRSVGLLEVGEAELRGTGTAFLVNKDLILTTSHVVGRREEWSNNRYRIDFGHYADRPNAGSEGSILDATPYPWPDSAARDLHNTLAEAYDSLEALRQILPSAGVPRQHLLDSGTAFKGWEQALNTAASMGRTRALIDVVLEDSTISAHHKKIRKLLRPETKFEAVPVAMDWDEGWAALRLKKPPSLAPLALGSASHLVENSAIIIIQHPLAEFKQFALEPNGVAKCADDYVHYRADTRPGSSGAPVFDGSMRLVAIHSAAGPRDTEDMVNFGVRVDRVKKGLEAEGLSFVEAASIA